MATTKRPANTGTSKAPAKKTTPAKPKTPKAPKVPTYEELLEARHAMDAAHEGVAEAERGLARANSLNTQDHRGPAVAEALAVLETARAAASEATNHFQELKVRGGHRR